MWHRFFADPTDPEQTIARLRRCLAQPGPHDARIGHRQTQAGNTDPTRIGLAVGSRPTVIPPKPAAKRARPAGERLHIVPKGNLQPVPVVVPPARRRVARG